MTAPLRHHPRLSIWPIALAFNALLLAVCVFVVTQEVKQHEASITQYNRQILAEQQTMRVLDAEWAYLTRPQRLEELLAMRDGKADEMKAETAKVEEAPAPAVQPSEDVSGIAPSSGATGEITEETATEMPVIAAVTPTPKPTTAPKKQVQADAGQKTAAVSTTQAAAPVQKKEAKKQEPRKQEPKHREPDIVWSIKRPVALPKQAQLAPDRYPARAGIAKPILE